MTNTELKKELSDSEILILTIIGEARGEPVEGQIAVGHIILNRVVKRSQDIKTVCLADGQFSCWNQGDPNRHVLVGIASEIMKGSYDFYFYRQIQWVVEGLLAGKIKDNIKGFDHYMTLKLFNSDQRPRWAKFPKKDPIIYGRQIFFTV